jgi:hypothetical protein
MATIFGGIMSRFEREFWLILGPYIAIPLIFVIALFILDQMGVIK